MVGTRRRAGIGRGAALVMGVLAVVAALAAVIDAADSQRVEATGQAPATIAEVRAVVAGGDGRWLEVTALVDTEVADPDAVLAELAPGASMSGGVNAAFALWRKWEPQDIPVTVSYNPDWDASISAKQAMQWSLQQWNSIEGSSFRFVEGADTDKYINANDCVKQIEDGVNSIRFSYSMPPGTLGLTCGVWEETGGLPRFLEFDIQMNGGVNWTEESPTPANAWDLRSTMLHELGHALGLLHTEAAGAVMLSTLKPGIQQRTITDDDREGVLSLYEVVVLDFKRYTGMTAKD